jgi:N-acetylglucosaminyl-diphospho-decaprenol L-rhamnosyltransferase
MVLTYRWSRADDMVDEAHPTHRPLVSVVVVTYNSAEVIDECLASVRSVLPGAEVVVVDNGSTDRTLVKARRSGAAIVSGHGNVGFGGGVNRGAQAAGGKLLLILNPDATLVSANVGELESLGEASSVGLWGCLVRESISDHFLVARLRPWRYEALRSLARWFVLPPWLTNRPRRAPSDGHGLVWVAGAAFLVGREEFIDGGGFDESFFLYYEDYDLSRWYQERGISVGTTRAVVATHDGQRSSPRDEARMIAFAILGLVQYVSKWEGPAAAESAALLCIRILQLVESFGGTFSWLPIVGARGAKKGRLAENVRGFIVQDAGDPLTTRYLGAVAALHWVESRSRSSR